MRYLLMGWVCLAATMAVAAPEFVTRDILVGKTKIALPLPKELRWVARETSWVKERIEVGEHLAKDPRMNVTFVVMMVTPAQYAEADKTGAMDGNLACWAVVPTIDLEKRHSLAYFRGLADGLSEDEGPLKGGALQVKDKKLQEFVDGFSSVAVFGRTDRSLQTLTRSEDVLVAGAYVLVEGKVVILSLTRSKNQARELLADMDAWVAQILKQTKP